MGGLPLKNGILAIRRKRDEGSLQSTSRKCDILPLALRRAYLFIWKCVALRRLDDIRRDFSRRFDPQRRYVREEPYSDRRSHGGERYIGSPTIPDALRACATRIELMESETDNADSRRRVRLTSKASVMTVIRPDWIRNPRAPPSRPSGRPSGSTADAGRWRDPRHALVTARSIRRRPNRPILRQLGEFDNRGGVRGAPARNPSGISWCRSFMWTFQARALTLKASSCDDDVPASISRATVEKSGLWTLQAAFRRSRRAKRRRQRWFASLSMRSSAGERRLFRVLGSLTRRHQARFASDGAVWPSAANLASLPPGQKPCFVAMIEG